MLGFRAPMFIGCALTILRGTVVAQPAPKRQSFEVVSVRANLIQDPSDPRYTGATDYIPRRSGNRIIMRNSSLRAILAWAFRLTNVNFQLVSGRWEKNVWEDSYDIEALTSGPAGDEDLRQMFQTLLEERFNLKVHREVRELPGFDLILIRNSSKLIPAPPRPTKNSLGFGGSSSWVEITDSGPRLIGKGASMEELAVILSGKVNAPVRDRTGLTGAFDYNVAFSSGHDTSDAPLLTTAIHDLGLNLKKGRGEFQVLVIDRLEKPSGN